jgi:hypothetical protein
MSEAKGFDPVSEDAPARDAASDTQPLERLLASGDGWDPVAEDDSWAPDSQSDQLDAMMHQDDTAAPPVITSSGTFDAPVHHNPMPDENAPPGPPAADSHEAILCSGARATAPGAPQAAPQAAPLAAPLAAPNSAPQPAPKPAPPESVASQAPAPSEARPHGESDRTSAASNSRRPSGIQEAYNSNEAILGSDVAPGDASSVSRRERLPSRADAPAHPVENLVDSRPAAWAIPATLLVGGVGAGVYVFASANPILGGIAIALTLVGSLFLRVLLKQ